MNLKEDEDADLFSPDLFLNKSYTTETFQYGDQQIQLEISKAASTDWDLTGQVVWPAASLLCRYIEHHGRRGGRFEGKKAVELGSGVGLCGILLARYCKSVVLTDHNEVVMDLLRKNAQLNQLNGEQLECFKLDWEADLERFVSEYPEGFDTLVGSDIIFWKECIPALLNLVKIVITQRKKHLSTNNIGSEPEFILTYYERSKIGEDFLRSEAIKMGFEIEEVDLESFIEKQEVKEKFQLLHCLVFKLRS